LADAILHAWKHPGKWLTKGFQRPAVLDEMQTETAARKLIETVELVQRRNRSRQ
jgi:hypothetical protein